MANPTTRTSTPPQSGRIAQQSPVSSVVPGAYADTDFPSIAFTNQLAINLTGKTLAYYDANGAWQSILGANDVQTYYGPTAPTTGLRDGDRWFNTTTLIWATWNATYNAWMPGSAAYGPTPPTAPAVGQPWYNDGTLLFWNGTSWVLGTDTSAPGAYNGAFPAAATLGSTWIDSVGIAWTCITGYTSGGTMANWQRVIFAVDPLAALITGDVIVAGEATSAPTPSTSVAITTGLLWLDITHGPNLGIFYIYDGTSWRQVYAPNTIELCLALVAARNFIEFLNTDTTAVTAGSNVLLPLTYVPIPGSIQVYYAGMALQNADWSRVSTLITIPTEPWMQTGDPVWADYAYAYVNGLGVISPVITSPTSGSSTPLTFTVSGTGAPGYQVQLWVDGSPYTGSVDSPVVGSAGAWSIVGVSVTSGAHTLVARQMAPDGSYIDSPPVPITAVAVPAGIGALTTSLTSSIAIPTGTVAGNLLVLAMVGVSSSVSDPRVISYNQQVDSFFPPVDSGVWLLRADGSGAPIPLTNNSTAIMLRVSGDTVVNQSQFTNNPSGNGWTVGMPAGVAELPIVAATCRNSGVVSGRLDNQVNWTQLGHVYDGNKRSAAIYWNPGGTFPAMACTSTGSDNSGDAQVIGVNTI